jgi:integrase
VGKSSGSRASRKPLSKPKKPYAEFPLTPHASGKWQKKIRGQIHYFGAWARRENGVLVRVEGDGWKGALEEYKKVADDLHAGRTPRVRSEEGLTVKDLCNHFLTAKLRQRDAGELTLRMFEEYKLTTDMMVAAFGAPRLVADLAADDFATLRATMVKKWGPLRVVNAVTRTKTVFKYGFEVGLTDRPPRYGPEFAPPSRSVLRRHRAKAGVKMFEAADVRLMLDGKTVEGEGGPTVVKPEPALRAMILLGVNAGFGNGDCAAVNPAAVNLETGWLEFPRPKTGVGRRCKLWPETVEAIRAALAVRPKPKELSDCELLFLTYRGTAWVRQGDGSRSDYVSQAFNRLTKALGLTRAGCGFYTLRHVFRTVADGARDNPAVRYVMGHVDASIDAAYRERIEDDRLEAVAEHVRKWLWPEPTDGK